MDYLPLERGLSLNCRNLTGNIPFQLAPPAAAPPSMRKRGKLMRGREMGKNGRDLGLVCLGKRKENMRKGCSRVFESDERKG